MFMIVGDYNSEKFNPTSFDPITLIVGIYFIVFLASTIKLVKQAFETQAANQQLEKKQFETELRLNEAKLELLKAQLHPHFLFNTLNNLYGLTLEKSDDAPKLVLRFSELLDYMLYRSNSQKVSLKNEIDYIENLSEIERLRHGDKLKLKIHTSGSIENISIAPMLLLPFVENAFKHGIQPTIKNPFINIQLETNQDQLLFRVRNSASETASKARNNNKGIGLTNIKKRLELLYKDKHELHIEDLENEFRIRLVLNH